MLHLLRVDVDGLLGRGEAGLGRLRVGSRGHGGRGGRQGRVHLLLGRVAQVQGGLRGLVRRVLHGAGRRVAAPVLPALLALARGGGGGLRVLRVGVQRGTRVWVLLGDRGG